MRFFTEEPAVAVYLSDAYVHAHLHVHTYTHCDNQVSKKQTCKQMGKNILKEMILMFYSCQRGK